MKINLTKKQYRDLLEVVLIGNWVRGGLFDQGLYSSKDYDQIEDCLLSKADAFGSKDLVEIYKGKDLPSDELDHRIETIIEDYEDSTFWECLERDLGQRDLDETVTALEKKEMKKNGGWYPERINDLYKKYQDEFEKNGIKNIRIVK